MSAAIYPTAPIYAGDTWPGIPGITIVDDGQPPADPVATARMVFYQAEDGPETPALTLTGEAEIQILDATNWELAIPPLILALRPGEWTFRFSTTTTVDGTVRTWLTGTLTIL